MLFVSFHVFRENRNIEDGDADSGTNTRHKARVVLFMDHPKGLTELRTAITLEIPKT